MPRPEIDSIMHHSGVRENSNREARRAVQCRERFAAGIILLLLPRLANAQESDRGVDTTQPTRPTILSNKWEEDWSVLADPRVPRQPFDNLKYIPLSPSDPKTYLSLGADLRERFEANDTAGFGIVPDRNNDYLISRTGWCADLRHSLSTKSMRSVLSRQSAKLGADSGP
jgi:hypothetical protein